MVDFRKKTETEIRGKYVCKQGCHAVITDPYVCVFRCHLGGMMYDLWESLLLESELESQVVHGECNNDLRVRMI